MLTKKYKELVEQHAKDIKVEILKIYPTSRIKFTDGKETKILYYQQFLKLKKKTTRKKKKEEVENND